MSSTIDFGTLSIGALIGVGCRKQLKAAGRIAASAVASLAGAAAVVAAKASDDIQANNGGKQE